MDVKTGFFYLFSVVLLFAAKDREVNHATVLAQWLRA